MEKIGAKLRFKGTVQGVGFRPFLYNLANEYGAVGYVRNLGDAGVEVRIEGESSKVGSFIRELRTRFPPICEISDLEVQLTDFSGRYEEFAIQSSDEYHTPSGSMIPPDIGICAQCVNEILKRMSRWYLYPFTCCASCGPRFTALLDLPYDRHRTNMASFPMCANCLDEYGSPTDRRFHAQGICCASCGPSVKLYDHNGRLIEKDGSLERGALLLDEGAILAVKGIGGTHVVASAIEDGALLKLREGKGKPFQPFAVMSKDIDDVRRFALVSDLEAELLENWRRPIVTLKRRSSAELSELVSPGLDTVGVMLPYTGIHLLLTHLCRVPALVVTSGNISGLPMSVTNDEAIQQLSGIVDYFLLHNREILARCDDSVIRVLDGVPTLIRRSRGFVPTPIEVPVVATNDVMAVGAELRTVGCVLQGNRCYLTQHIGDVDNLETMAFLQDALGHLLKLMGITPKKPIVARDLHPRYLTSRLAGDLSAEWNGTVVPVQHHHAHAASLMAENKIPLDESVVVIAADGVGFGADGEIWGGEILISSYTDFERVGHLARQPMPGGDACTVFPLRMCAAILSEYLDDNHVRSVLLSKKGNGRLDKDDLERIGLQLKSGVAMSWTSSTGRVLDAMAAGAGICLERTYEGEPAMRLEAAAADGDPKSCGLTNDLIVRDRGTLVVDTTRLLLEAVLALGKASLRNICASFQWALANALASLAVEVAEQRGIRKVGVTGGCAVNARIVDTVRRRIEDDGLLFLQHGLIPPGDGGISLGQAVVASLRL